MKKILGTLMLIVWVIYLFTKINWLLPILGMLIGYSSATLIFEHE